MTEAELLAGIMETLALAGWRTLHLGGDQRGVYRGDAGFPDLFAIHPDGFRALAWELKTDRGAVTLEQAGWIALLRTIGMSAYLDVRVVRPADYDDALAWILQGSAIRSR